MNLKLHHAAEVEVQKAYDYYYDKDPAIAEELLNLLDRSFEAITQFPERYPKYQHGTRRAVLKKFPYQLIYTLRNEAVLILAVAHSRKKPGYWSARRQ